MIRLGIIGYRNHAQRLIQLCDNNDNCKLKYIFHPTTKINDKRGTNDFSDLFTCDGIIIASPNNTHLEYIIKILKTSKARIFCEKPPVDNKKDLRILQSLPNKYKHRIFFNFNLRFSNISKEIASHKNSRDLKKIIQINIVNTHGLSFKKEYKNSWRANGENNLHNILDTLAIHYIDLMNFHFGKVVRSIYFPYNSAKTGTSFDTAQITLEYSNGVIANIFTSYSAPKIYELSIIGINGNIIIRDKRLTIFSPRDNFNEKGFFIKPLIKSEKKFSLEQDYEKSLKKSMDFFVNTIKNKGFFELCHFKTSISTTNDIISYHVEKKL